MKNLIRISLAVAALVGAQVVGAQTKTITLSVTGSGGDRDMTAAGLQVQEGDTITITTTPNNFDIGNAASTGCLSFTGTATAGTARSDATGVDFYGTANPSSSSVEACTRSQYRAVVSADVAVSHTFQIADDTVSEPDETITLALTGAFRLASGGGALTSITAGTPSSITVTILASDPATVSITRTGAATLNEGQSAEFTVTMSAANAAAVTVPYSVAGSGAYNVASGDQSGSVTIPAGDTSATLSLALPVDGTLEAADADQTITVTLTADDPATTATDEGPTAATNGGAVTRTTTTSGQSAAVTVNFINNASTLTITGPTTLQESDADYNTGDYTITRTGAEFTSSVTFTITLGADSDASTANADVSGGGSADAGASAASVTFAAGEDSKVFHLTITGDDTDEMSEVFTISTSGGAAVTHAAPLVVTIRDDDTTDDETQIVGYVEGTQIATREGLINTVQFRVELNGMTATDDVTFTYTIVPGPGFTVDDITAAALTGTETLDADASTPVTTRTLQVTSVDDDLNEADETFTVTATAMMGSAVIPVRVLVGDYTFTDNDPITATLSDASSELAEGAMVTVNLDHTPTRPVTVAYTLGRTAATDDTDADAADLTVEARRVTFPAGTAPTAMALLTVTDDALAEAAETFTVAITSAQISGAYGDATGDSETYTIAESDQPHARTLTVTGPATFAETDANAETGNYTITLTGEAFTAASTNVTWQVTTGNAAGQALSADLVAATDRQGTVTFSSSEGNNSTKTFTLTVAGDNLNEADETFTVNVFVASPMADGGTAYGTDHTTTITDDDDIEVTFDRRSGQAASVAESASLEVQFGLGSMGGTRTADATIPFTISGVDNAEYAITTPSGIAATATGGTITLAGASPTTTGAFITVTVTGNNLNEAARTLTITGGTLNTAGGIAYTTGGNSASVEITDDDAITVSIADPSPATQNEGSTILFPVSFAGATSGSAAAIEVAYTVDWVAASTGTFMVLDGGSPLTIAAGDTMGNIRVRILHSIPLDSMSADEMLRVTLGTITPATGAGSASGSGNGTVTVNWIDAAHTIEVADATVDEGAATITVTRSASMDLVQAVDIMWEVTTSGTGATHAASADIAGGFPMEGTVTFSGSQETATINLPIIDDNFAEMAETFTLTLSENIDMATQTANSVVAADDTATVTITDNDTISIRIGGPSRISEERMVTFPVALSAQPSVALTMNWAVAAATSISSGTLAASCAAPSDMVAADEGDFADSAGAALTSFPSGMLNFGMGVTTANIEFSTSAGAQSTSSAAAANTDGNWDESCDRWFTITLSSISGGGGTMTPAAPAAKSAVITEDNPEAITALNEAVLPEVARAVVVNQVSALAERVGQAAGGGAVFTPSFNLNGATNMAEMAAKNARDWAKNDGLDTKELLRDMDFVMPFSAAGDSALGNRMALWGGSDYRDFKGEDDATEWDGEMFSFHLGADARVNERLLVGVMVTHSDAESDYQFDDNGRTSRGDYDLEMTGFSPYLSWDLGDAGSAWFSVGYGQGDLTIDPDDVGDDTLTSDVDMTSFSAGGARTLRESGAHELRIKGDVFMASVDVDGDDTNPNLAAVEVDASRARLLLESRHKFALASGAQLTPLVDMGARYDGGDGQTGSGLELGGGMHYFDPAIGLTAEARARVLIGHSADQDEWGVGGVVRLAPGVDGQGLSLALTPSYGDAEADTQGMWDNGVARVGSAAKKSATDPAATLAVEVGYGMPASGLGRVFGLRDGDGGGVFGSGGVFGGAGLLTPYSALRFGDNNDYRVGLRWTADKRLSLDMSARHLKTDNRLTLEGKLKF